MPEPAEHQERPGGWEHEGRFVISELSRLTRSSEHVDRRLEEQGKELSGTTGKLDSLQTKVRHVAGGVRHLRNERAADSEKLTVLQLKMANLQFRQTVFGLLAMAVPSAVAAFLWWLSQHH